MAFDVTLLLALLLLFLGAGLLRGNLAPQVTTLYREGDRRQSAAFQLFYVGIDLGAFIAPLATGTLAVVYGWHFGCGFAGCFGRQPRNGVCREPHQWPSGGPV